MLNKNNMGLLSTGYVTNIEEFNSGNGQNIREYLLRQACISCESYATDILILINGESIDKLFNGIANEIDIYFRDFGIDWESYKGENEENRDICLSIAKQYRKTMKLVYDKDRSTLYLYCANGNC
jgi:hypothetical protein